MSSEILDCSVDNPITALQECFTESNLPHERISAHAVRLTLQGDWQEYLIVFRHCIKDGSFSLSGTLNTETNQAGIETLYRLIGRINAELTFGHYTLDEVTHQIGYRYVLPESLLSGLDIDGLEALIEHAVVALENLYPMVQSLLFGAQSLDVAMGKYIHAAKGSA